MGSGFAVSLAQRHLVRVTVLAFTPNGHFTMGQLPSSQTTIWAKSPCTSLLVVENMAPNALDAEVWIHATPSNRSAEILFISPAGHAINISEHVRVSLPATATHVVAGPQFMCAHTTHASLQVHVRTRQRGVVAWLPDEVLLDILQCGFR